MGEAAALGTRTELHLDDSRMVGKLSLAVLKGPGGRRAAEPVGSNRLFRFVRCVPPTQSESHPDRTLQDPANL
jgi:hypothetical protein